MQCVDANADEPRYLARVGYTHVRHLAVDQLEAVDEDEQRRQTAAAHRRWREQVQRDWGAARSTILDGVERFKSSGRLNRKLAGDVRVLERQVSRIDRDVGLGQ